MAEINQGQAANADTPTPVASHTTGHFPFPEDGEGDGADGAGAVAGSAPKSMLTEAMRQQTPDGVKMFLEGDEFKESW